MTKKPRENRVPIMMSEAELKAIDDWRFENRVATRSDAVRRLCQLGLHIGADSVRGLRLALDLSYNIQRATGMGPDGPVSAEDQEKARHDVTIGTYDLIVYHSEKAVLLQTLTVNPDLEAALQSAREDVENFPLWRENAEAERKRKRSAPSSD